MGNGKGGGEGETMHQICHPFPCGDFSASVATFPAGIHKFDIKVFWAATASTGLVDGIGVCLDHGSLSDPKAPYSRS